MPSLKRKFGDMGEDRAVSFLIQGGYKILDRNYRVKNLGEIDIVAERGNKIVFIEVKTRDVNHEGNFPYWTSITPKKKRNLKRICKLYLIDKKCSFEQEWQVDTIFIKVDFLNHFHSIEHLENILWEKYY